MIDKRIILGTAQFTTNYNYSLFKNKFSRKEKNFIIKFANKKGIKIFETSPAYGDAEKFLGMYPNSGNIIWKVPKLKDSSLNVEEQNLKIIKNSLEKLKRDSFHTILLHSAEDLIGKKGKKLFDLLIELKKKGICKKIGVSLYKKKTLRKIFKKFKIDVIQLPFNIIQNEFSDLELINLKKKFKSLEIHARSVFHQGLLLKKIKKSKNPKFKNLMNEQNKILDQLLNICKKKNCDLLDLCVSYVTQKKFIDKIVIGVENTKELSQILNYRKVKNINFKKIIYNKSILDPISWLKLKY